MSRASSSPPDVSARSRTAFIAVLLLLALGLTVAVGWQAHDATRSHRETAEAVLEDYAALAAGEMIRRSLAVFLRTYNYRLRTTITRALEAGGLPTRDGEVPLPAPGELRTDGREDLERIFGLARFTFRYRTGDPESLETAGAPVSKAERAWLQDVLERSGPQFPEANLPYLMLYGPPDLPLMALYWAEGEAVGEGPDERLLPGARVVGFAYDRQEMRRVFADALAQGPVLPAALTDGEGAEVGNEHVRISVRDWLGAEIFRSEAEVPAEGAPGAELGFDRLYDGILFRWTVRAEIAPGVASRLIIGGLPRSRLPGLLALLVLAVGLVAAALRLLTRERELTRLRSDFVSRVSHELRTPLTQIRMFAETLLLDRVRSPEERRRSIEIVDAEARRLSHLVENILQLSRSERRALRLAPERRDLSRTLEEIVSELQPLLESGRLGAEGGAGGTEGTREGVRLETDIEPGIVARVDPDALRQVVLNLLDNAVKYGTQAGTRAGVRVGTGIGARVDARGRRSADGPPATVRLTLERHSHRVRMAVEDEGPGVPRRERERIWRRFHRLDRDSEKAGTGIGLAVVRELVLGHEGTVWVESGRSGRSADGTDVGRDEPRGARFVVELPAEPPAESPAESSDDSPEETSRREGP